MWRRWIPWRFLIKRMAQAQGFIDPVNLLANLQRFAQPSEVMAPVEILRLSAVLHARGLLNSQAIQHNLDWVWPYWVVRQFDPRDPAFVPRAFSLTHINLTHRNWTAIGLPGVSHYPIVDPRGLVTPFYDSWSVDAWIVRSEKEDLVPSRAQNVRQEVLNKGNLAVETTVRSGDARLFSRVEMYEAEHGPACCIRLRGVAGDAMSRLAVSLRPFNPEGVSFVRRIQMLDEGGPGWKINGKTPVYFSETPDEQHFSRYREGDVYRKVSQEPGRTEVTCDVEMATAAALYRLSPGSEREICVHIPLTSKGGRPASFIVPAAAAESWDRALEGVCLMDIPEGHFQFLYDTALRTVVLHSPDEVYPGPYTYKHFWFRDAVVILHAMLCANLREKVEEILATFPERQTVSGYFRSQEGEWDSNGQVLWLFQRYCELTGRPLPDRLYDSAMKAARWILKKRTSEKQDLPHAGLFPAGFSAEHLGPNDYYYWDDFWGVAGLKAAAFLARGRGDKETADHYMEKASDFMRCIERSLEIASGRMGHAAMPASPYRRMDTGAIGSIPVDYPLQLWNPGNIRVKETLEYLVRECFVEGGFFHDMSHSGINPYLTLHIAQALLRSGDSRYYEIVRGLAAVASPTGQWPEAVHPVTFGGCMGDGQHVWAAAEWALMMRYFFVREEEDRLVLFPGIPETWLSEGSVLSFGPAPTRFGTLKLSLRADKDNVEASWECSWRKEPRVIEIALAGREPVQASPSENSLRLAREVLR